MIECDLRAEECFLCHDVFEYMPETVNNMIVTDSMPDGYLRSNGTWICDECGSCQHCGTSLEKRPDQIGKENPRECDNDDCIKNMRQ